MDCKEVIKSMDKVIGSAALVIAAVNNGDSTEALRLLKVIELDCSLAECQIRQ